MRAYARPNPWANLCSLSPFAYEEGYLQREASQIMTRPSNSTVLISGAGIGGPCLAYWLLRYGYRPTIVEAAPKFREGGYLIDFWGIGFDVAEKMGMTVPYHQQSH